jgi:hypothetical protein
MFSIEMRARLLGALVVPLSWEHFWLFDKQVNVLAHTVLSIARTPTCGRQADAGRVIVGGHEIHFDGHSAYCKLKLCS